MSNEGRIFIGGSLNENVAEMGYCWKLRGLLKNVVLYVEYLNIYHSFLSVPEDPDAIAEALARADLRNRTPTPPLQEFYFQPGGEYFVDLVSS